MQDKSVTGSQHHGILQTRDKQPGTGGKTKGTKWEMEKREKGASLEPGPGRDEGKEVAIPIFSINFDQAMIETLGLEERRRGKNRETRRGGRART